MESTEALSRPVTSSRTVPAPARAALLNPWPRITLGKVAFLALVIAAYYWGLKGTNADPRELVEGIPNIVRFLLKLFPPIYTMREITLPWAAVLPATSSLNTINIPEIILAIIETVQMAVIGTTLAVFLSLPFGLLAARNTSPYPVVYQATRMVMNMVRAIPEIIFALIFVSAVGLGPFGGVLALAVGSIGFLGKMYAESIEAIDPQQVLAVRATGASRLQVFGFSVVPQALPLMVSASLYSFEHNVRSATILGLVGAGGVGFIITKHIALFQFKQLMGALILIIITVTAIDRISDRLRKKLI